MAGNIDRILRAFEGTPWALQPEKLRQIAEVLAVKATTGQIPEASEIEAAEARQRRATVRAGSIAVIPLFGTIAQRMTMLDAMSGGTSLEVFGEAFQEAAADEDVSAIVVRFDSPGGSVFGIEEAAAMIAETARSKPVVAVLDPLAASAAYWLATQASEVVVTPSGQGGSIGVFSVHLDHSEELAEKGIRVTIIKAGDNKAEGTPFAPLTDGARAHLQSLVDAYAVKFVAAVAAGRAVSTDTVLEAFGQGRLFEAERMVELGMVDRIATFEAVLNDLKADAKRASLMTPAASRAVAHDRLAASAANDATPVPVRSVVESAVAEFARIAGLTATSSSTRSGPGTTGTTSIAPITSASAGDVAPEPTSTPTEPAPAAREEPMSGMDTAAPTHGADSKDAVLAERQRARDIRAIGQEHQIDAETYEAWIDDGVSVEAARKLTLDAIRARAKDAPIVRATVRDRAGDDPRRGFRSPREFLMAVLDNSGYRNRADVPEERLRPLAVFDSDDRNAPNELAFMLPTGFTPTGISAAAGSDEQGGYQDRYGGFAVPTTTLPGFMSLGAEADPTAGRTMPVPMATPGVDIVARTDKNHSTSVSGGLTVTRRPETVAATSSRTEIEKVALKATSLFGLAYATEEILTDSAISFVALLASGFEEQFAFHMLNEKLHGNGGAEYLGLLNAPALVSVAKEGGQAADTIVALNVINMRARCWGYDNAIWLANHDTYPQLIQAAIVKEGAAGGGLILVYQRSLQEDRPDMLLGRPIFYSEQTEKLGDKGDIMLANWSQYLEGLYQPLQSDESVHVRFVNHERAFKFWLRNAGQPWWRSALTPHKGANTLSPFVTLDERA